MTMVFCISQLVNERACTSETPISSPLFLSKVTLDFGHLMQRADSLEKTLMLGKIEGKDKGPEDKAIGWHH